MSYAVPAEVLQCYLPENGWQAKEGYQNIRMGSLFTRSILITQFCDECGNQWLSNRGLLLFVIGYSKTRKTRYIKCLVEIQHCKLCEGCGVPSYFPDEFADALDNLLCQMSWPPLIPKSVKKRSTPLAFEWQMIPASDI